MDKGVRFIRDILKEVAEEEGRTQEEMRELWRIHKAYLRSKLEEKDTYIVEIPQIGNLYFSNFLFRLFNAKSRKKYNELDGKSKKLDTLLSESKGLEKSTSYTYPQERRPSILKMYKSINKHIKNKKKSYSTNNKIIKEIEKYSNDE